MRIPRKLAVLVAAAFASIGLVVAGSGVAVAATSNNTQIQQALSHAGSLVNQAVSTTTDGDSAAQNANVDIPIEPAKGVALKGSDGKTITMGLPNADKLGRGTKLTSGAVLYRGGNGVDVVVIPGATSAQFLTIINRSSAPENYAYPASVPQGGKIALVGDEAVVLDSNGAPVARIAKAWAFDAHGGQVPTRFIATGSTLTQHIAHQTANMAYPVVADPSVTFHAINYKVRFSKQEVKNLAPQFWATVMVGVAGAACGRLKGALQLACGGLVAAVWFWIDRTFDEAAANNQCVWIGVSYGGDLDGWGRYSC